MPINTQGRIEQLNATIRLGMIKLVTLILEHGGLTEHREAMRKALINKHLPMILPTNLYRLVLPISRGVFPQIYGYIEHRPADDPNQLSLRKRR